MRFEIVTHCYEYSTMLVYQLSSLVLFPPSPEHSIQYTVVYNNKDRATVATFEYFMDVMPANITIVPFHQSKGYLFQRAHAREIRGRKTWADWVWYADADYVFRNKVWDQLANQLKDSTADGSWPSWMWRTSYIYGRQLNDYARDRKPQVLNVKMRRRDITKAAMAMAIGGIQIVRGDWLRKNGMVGTLYPPAGTFKSKSDAAWRKRCPNKSPVNIDHILRICTQHPGAIRDVQLP